jgi:hypothetical protein
LFAVRPFKFAMKITEFCEDRTLIFHTIIAEKI